MFGFSSGETRQRFTQFQEDDIFAARPSYPCSSTSAFSVLRKTNLPFSARLALKALVRLALSVPFVASYVVLAQGEQLPPSSIQRAGSVSPREAPAAPSLPATNPWTAATPFPTTIARYAFVQVGEDLYVISGVSSSQVVVKTVRRYNATTNVWTSRADIPVGSEAPAGAFFGGKIYVADGASTAFHIYDVATNTWSNGPPRPVSADSFGAAAGAFNGNVYVVGGSFPPTTTLSIYNIASNTWSAGPAAPSHYQLGGYAQIGQFLYLIGSFPDVDGFNSTVSMRLDMATNTWSIGPVWTPARADFALAAAGTKLIAIGGDIDGGGLFDASAQVDELETSTWPGGAWVPSPDNLPSPRQANQAGFVSTGRVGGEIWSTGGIAPGNVVLNEHLFRAAPTCPCPPPPAPPGVLYVLNDSTGGNQIYAFSVNETTGVLTPLSGFPLTTGGNGAGLSTSEQLAIDLVNQRLYAINDGSDTVSAYSINPTTGTLAPLPFSPIALGVWELVGSSSASKGLAADRRW